MGIHGYSRIFSLKSYLWALTDVTGIFVDKIEIFFDRWGNFLFIFTLILLTYPFLWIGIFINI